MLVLKHGTGVFFRVWMHISLELKLLLNPSKLDPSLSCSFIEQLFGIWEGSQQLNKFLLFQTESVGRTVYCALVALRGAQVHKDLVVAEVIGLVEAEILILVLLDQTDGHTALENHVQF